MAYKVVVIGGTGLVGHEIVTILSERNFPISELVVLDQKRASGAELSFGEKDLTVQPLETYNFKGTDIVFSSATGEISKEYAPKIAAAGAVMIDQTSYFRTDPDVPLIVPEANADAISGYERKRVIANPNCTTTAMVVALKPLHDLAKIKRVVVSTYQSVSGAGKAGMDELFNQSRKFFVTDGIEHSVFAKQIAFNVLPAVDAFMDDGSTREEWNMMAETKKILGKEIKVSTTCVRVPSFVGHGMAINVEFENDFSAKQAREAWRHFKGVTVIDERSEMEYVTPVEIAGEDDVYISRIRDDITVENGISFWCVSDNLRKGAALNSVHIAEELIKNHLKS
jgi:aspartate-semialdehyde dehydrogenase